jgi:nucleoid-associated protein YgaU
MRLNELRAIALAGLLALTACATTPDNQQQALQAYRSYAGPPIRSFTWLGHFDSWQALGKDHLVVFTTPWDAYLLTIWSPCDLRFVINRIGISSTSGTVYSGLDSIIVNGPNTGRWTCPISEIRKVDYQRMRADQKAQAAAARAARQTEPPAPAAPPTGAPPPPQ